MSYFQDKVIAIMGGEGGMGSATAWLLALQGARVSFADYEIHPEKDFRNRDACKMLGEIKKSTVDIRKEHIVKLWIEKTVSDFGKIDGFVNFAGIVSKDFLNV
jgi:NAD(P)-dependent dehydrogenase (short-subunit alcohol dehydrogenase family)